MFNFTTDLPEDPRGNSLPLMRCPTNRAVSGIILSTDLVGTRTHYFHGRTIPCDDNSCPACSEALPWRWHAYVAVYSPGSHRTVLFEMTARCAESLIQYRDTYGTLRGCQLTAKRANSSPNSRVILQTAQADLQKIALPAEPDVLEALSIIWNIERPSISVEGRTKQQPELAVRQNRLLQQSTLPTSTPASPLRNPNGNGS